MSLLITLKSSLAIVRRCSMATFCPYCDEEIESEIYDAWTGDYWESYNDFDCPWCGKFIKIVVEMIPDFSTSKNNPW